METVDSSAYILNSFRYFLSYLGLINLKISVHSNKFIVQLCRFMGDEAVLGVLRDGHEIKLITTLKPAYQLVHQYPFSNFHCFFLWNLSS